MSIIDANIEKQILTGLIVSDEFCKQVTPLIDANPKALRIPFANEVSRWCIKYFEKYAEAPHQQIKIIYEMENKKGKLNEEQAELIEEFLDGLSNEYQQDQNYKARASIDNARDYIRAGNIETLQKQLSLNLQKGNTGKAEKLVADFKALDFETNIDDIFKAGITAKDLKHQNIPEIKWIIEGIIPKGLTLLAGKAKVGKSFFLLNVAIDLSSGRRAFDAILTETSEVLYLGLEEPAQRTKTRIDSIIKDGKWPERLHIFGLGTWPKSDAGGFERLELWMKKHPDTQLIIIDTLAKFKSPKKNTNNKTEYQEEYQSLEKLHTFAGSHNIGVIVAHHARKTRADDVFDEIIGGMGIQAATDSLVVLERAKADKDTRIYNYRGRDIGEDRKTFRFKDNGRFILSENEAIDYRKDTKQRNLIQQYIEFYGVTKRKALVKAMAGKVGKGIDVILTKMVDAGNIEKAGWGVYVPRGWGKLQQEAPKEKELNEKMLRFLCGDFLDSKTQKMLHG